MNDSDESDLELLVCCEAAEGDSGCVFSGKKQSSGLKRKHQNTVEAENKKVKKIKPVTAGVPKPLQGNLWRVPYMLKAFVDLLATPALASKVTRGMERYCGQMAITKAFKNGGQAIVPMDKETVSDEMDLCKDFGFIFAFWMCLIMVFGGFSWSGIVCTTWIWISRSTYGRSNAWPQGDLTKKKVRQGNKMVSREMILTLVLACKAAHQFIEAPASTIMHKYITFKAVIRFLKLGCSKHWLGNYGAESPKPVKIWSTVPYLSDLEKPLDRSQMSKSQHGAITKITYKKNGKKMVAGGPGLRHTQTYPERWGKAIFQKYSEHKCLNDNPEPVPVELVEKFMEELDWNDSGLPRLIYRLHKEYT